MLGFIAVLFWSVPTILMASVQDGRLELQNNQQIAAGVTQLDGTWRWHKGFSQDPWTDWENGTRVTIPDFGAADLPHGDTLNGSYLLKIQADRTDLRFVIQYLVGAYRVRVCYQGVPVCEDHGGSGVISDKPENVVWHGIETRVALKSGTMLLVVDSSSFLNSKGFTAPPIIGPEAAVDHYQKHRLLHQAILIGAFAMIALHAGFLYFYSRRSQADLFVSLIALGFMIRYFVTEWLEWNYLPAGNTLFAFAFYSIFHTSALTLTAFAGLLHALYGGVWLKNLARTMFAATVAYMIAQLLFDLHFFMNKVNGPFIVLMFALFLVITGSVWQIFRRRERDSGLVLFSISILFMTTINDYCAGIWKTHDLYLLHYGVFAFSFCQSVITARRFDRTYRENEKLIEEISEKEQARTLFFHNTSHELRTPLNGLIGFLTLLRDQRFGRMTDQAREQLAKCLRLAESLKNQVNTILDLAKAKKGMLNLHVSVMSLPELVNEARELAEGLLLKKIDSRFEMQEDWDPASPDIIGDKEKLATIVRNLLGNAFKFADSRRPNHVLMRVAKKNGFLQIQVKDTGIGIPADQQAMIFEEFKQVSGDARRAYEGTGLGLSMVQNLVTLLGGSIEVQSVVDQGSTFTVNLPELSRQQLTAVKVESSSPPLADLPNREPTLSTLPAPKPAVHHATARLLVIDDNEINCEVIQHMLEETGYEVETTLSGRNGLERLRTRRFDLLLLDMMMPEMSGEDVIRTLRTDADLRDIPVILITARASDSDRIFGLSLGADDYLAKPLNADELIFRVKNTLDRLEMQRKGQDMEEQERMAQLGELLNDMSHELKNVFQFSDAATRLDRDAFERILRHLPVRDQAWRTAVSSIAAMKSVESAAVDMKTLTFPDEALAQDPTLRSLRMRLSYMLLSPADRLILWNAFLHMKNEDRILCDQTLNLVRSFIQMRDQTIFAQELIAHILSFNRLSPLDQNGRIQDAVASIRTMTEPKLIKMKMNWTENFPDLKVTMNVVHLRQILLNILSNAMRAEQLLPIGERWIRWEAVIKDGQLELRLSNAGEKIPDAIADRIFSRGFSGPDSDGRGLGLAISRRLIQRAGGSIQLDQAAGHPCFVILLPLARDAASLPKAS